MRKAHIRKKKRISFLFILTFGMILGSINVNQLIFTSNHYLVDEIKEDIDWIENNLQIAYVTSYSDSGADINVAFHQSYVSIDTIQFTNLSDSSNNTFTVPCPENPTFNSSSTYFKIENIYAPNQTAVNEIDTSTGDYDVSNADPGVASFTIAGNGYLENISVLLGNDVLTDNGTATIVLYKSKWVAGENIPDAAAVNNFIANFGSKTVINNTVDWYNFTNLHEPLDITDTANNTWYIGVIDQSVWGNVKWNYVRDDNNWFGDNDDECISRHFAGGWVKVEQTAPAPTSEVDFNFRVDVAPLNNTPAPNEIQLKIEGSLVTNGTSNDGYWYKQNQEYTDGDRNLDFELTAEWLDVSLDITNIQINYTKTDLKALSEFIVSESEPEIFWNVTIEDNVDWFDSRLEDSYINFTIPSQWNNVSVFNGGVEQTITVTPSNSKTVTALNAGNGTHWYLSATSDNLLDNVHYIINNILIIDKIVNFTNTIHFNASFNTFINSNDGKINVSVYSPSSQTLNFSMQNETFSSGFNISLGDWNMPNSIPYGVHTVQLYWSNDTDAGFVEDQLKILGETDLDVTFPAYTFNISDTFNIVAHFNDTGKNLPIGGNPISFQIGINSPRTDNIALAGNGSYIITINCNDSELTASGPNDITINANKQYYYNHTQTETITILRETSLTLLSHSEGSSYAYDSGDTFNITVQFNDTFESEGIDSNVLINYSIDGNAYRYDNVNYWENGKYNITIDCSDNDFGTDYGDLLNIIVNASRHYYHNQSVNFNVNITGETCLNYFYDSKPFYYSNETFYIISTYNDTVRNTNIDPFGPATDFLINGSSALVGPGIVGIAPGIWNITINCSFHQEFQDGNYGYYNLTFVGDRAGYYTSYNYTIIFIKGSTSFDVLSPAENLNYVDGEIFTITVQYNDTVKGEGVAGADIGYNLDGTTWLLNENVTDIGNGRYTIEIYANDSRMNYKWETILINASKQNYTEGETSFRFEKQITTTISPSTSQSLGSIMRGDIVSYLFEYNDTDGNPITGANWASVSSNFGFIITMNDYDNGTYKINLDSINVDVAGSPYTYIFNISALGNQTQVISLTLNVTNIATEVVIDPLDYNHTLIRRLGYNQTVLLYFNDTNNNLPITGVLTNDVIVRDNSTGSFEVRNGGAGDHNWTLYEIGGGDYMLNISIKGLDSGWIRFEINMSKLPNYNYGVAYIDFYIVGNSSQVAIQTMHDIDGKLITPGSGNNYTWIENRQIIINFTVEDTDYAPNLAIGQTTWHTAMWFNYNNPDINGSLTITPAQLDYNGPTRTHQGTMQTDALALGRYIINITIKIPNYEAVTFSFNLTVRVIIQTRIEYVSHDLALIQRDGFNQTIWLTFNNTEDDSPIGGLSTSNVFVYDNNTGSFLIRDGGFGDHDWTLYEDSGTIGLYKLNVSIKGLISGYIRLRINMSFYPDYDWSIIDVNFYLTGNSTQINVISWADEGGTIISLENGNYTWFDDRNVNVTFSVQDINNGNNDVSGNIDNYLVSWYDYSDASSGSLGFSYGTYGTIRYGLLTTYDLSLGSYIINFTVKINNYESTELSFNLTIRAKFEVSANHTLSPAHLTAGDQFNITLIFEYNNDSMWEPLSGTQFRLLIYINGGSTASTTTLWAMTDVNGTVTFSLISISISTTSVIIVIEIEEGVFYASTDIEITSISISPYVGGGIDPGQLMMWLIIIGVAIGAVAGSIGIYRGVIVPKKREKARILSEVKTIFDDAVNLEHILVLYKSSGMCIFFKSFGLEEIDPEMISGFLSAVSTFGKEMESQEMLNEITYGDKVLLLSDGEFVRVALVLGKNPSVPIRQNLKEFIAAFENSYANILPSWRGNLKTYQGAGIIVDEILNTSIILPHEIKHSSKGVKSLKKQNSKDILKIAQNLVADSERKYFFIGQLLTLATDKLDRDLAEIFMGIKELRDNKLLVPIEISAIEEKPISEQELNLIRQKVAQLTHLAPGVTEKLVNDIASITSPAEREAFIVSLGAHQTIVSAPVKGGAAVIDSEKSAKKEIKALLNKAAKAEKQDDFTRALEIYHNANVLASNYELAKLIDEINDLVRKATIHESDHKMRDYEEKAKKAVKTVKYKEAAQFYRLASDMASQMFKLGRTDMTKEVKRLTNKSKECERLGE